MSRAHVSRRSSAGRALGSGVLTVLSASTLLLAGSLSAIAAPAPAPASTTARAATGSTGVFAIDNDHHTVVFVPAAGGAASPVATGLTNPTQLAASRGGSIFIVDGTRLLKVTPRGAVLTIRSGMAPRADIAVDDNNYLFVLDGSSIVKYAPRDGSAPIAVGKSPGYEYASLTLDAVGNASLTGPNPADYLETLITTYPVRGGRPTTRKLVADYNPAQTYFNGPYNVVETQDGTIFLQTSESGGSGATDLYRVPAGPAGPTKAYDAMPRFSEYAFNVDLNNKYYLLQNRLWCAAPSRDEGSCVDDYGVDAVQRYSSSGTGRVDTAVTGVDLPVGGISVSSSGAIYGAVLVSRSAGLSNNTAVPRLLRIGPSGGGAVTLAKGHFSMPVAEDFLWYAG